MNLVILHGRLTKDIEIRYGQGASATTVANFSIAVRRDFTKQGQPESDFFNCVAFGKTAENLEKFFKKGYGIIVKGRLQNDTFEKDDKTKVTYTKVILDGFDFAEKSQGQANTQQPTSNSQPLAEDDDDLPF